MTKKKRWPCHEYDLPAAEGWLEKMAQKGLVLSKEPSTSRAARFDEREPRNTRYRFTPAAASGITEEEVQFHRDMGWEYITNRGLFRIFSSDDPEAPELNTDPHVFGLAMAPAIRRALLELLCYGVLALLWCLRVDVLPVMVETNSPLVLLFPLVWLLFLSVRIWQTARLLGLRRSCFRGTVPRLNSWLWFGRLGDYDFVLILCLFLALGFGAVSSGPVSRQEVMDSYARYHQIPEEMPFADSRSLLPELADRSEEEITVESWTTFLTEENWSCREQGTAQSAAGEVSYELQTSYIRFPSPFLAQWYARSLRSSMDDRADYQPLPGSSADGRTAYRTGSGIAVLLCRDSEVLQVFLTVEEGYTDITEDCCTAEELAGAILP